MVSKQNPFLYGFSGRAGNLVVKNYSGKAVISKVADMSKRVLSEKQKEYNRLMKHANILARNIVENPERKAEACEVLNVPPEKVYRALVKEYIKRKGEDRILPSLCRAPLANTGDPKDHIELNPDILNGKPVIRNTDITVEEILNQLSQGATIQQILTCYPLLRMSDVTAALAFAAKLASV